MFSNETEYALRSLIYIQTQNSKGLRPQVEEIARQIDAPRPFIAKILQRLVKYGFVMSAKGKNGGFFFKADNQEIVIKEVIVAVEGARVISSCILGLSICSSDKPCPLHEKFSAIKAALINLVESETIQSLARNYSGSFSVGSNLINLASNDIQ